MKISLFVTENKDFEGGEISGKCSLGKYSELRF